MEYTKKVDKTDGTHTVLCVEARDSETGEILYGPDTCVCAQVFSLHRIGMDGTSYIFPSSRTRELIRLYGEYLESLNLP